jgi:hypothetical protein
MSEHVGPWNKRQVQQWLLDLEKFVDEQVSGLNGLDEMAAEADKRGYAELVENWHQAAALRRDSIEQLKKFYLG